MKYLQPHQKQSEIVRSNARFKVIRAGRKGGKTALEVEIISFLATISSKKLNLTKHTFPSGRKILYIAPTQIQAREIVWVSFKNRLDGIAKFNEQKMQIVVPNEDKDFTTIMIGGWENRENYRGLTDVIHITFDEVDTLRNFFISYQDIFRPMFLDTGGTADFIGTPKKESGNLRRLEKQAQADKNYECFHFTSKDNPYLSRTELELTELEYKDNRESYRQEILAEYVENQGALFSFSALVDVFSNTIIKENARYLIVDIADDGSDKTIFSFWEGLEEYHREEFARLNTESIIAKIREYASGEKIPYSHIAVDAIGVGAGVASSSMLDGIIGFKSSYAPIKTDINPVVLPNVSYLKTTPIPLVSDYRNLRGQCGFTLANLVNNHLIASKVSGKQKEVIIEELSCYQSVGVGDGKQMMTSKEDVKSILGHSPDASDCFIMRMYFVIMGRMNPNQSEERGRAISIQQNQFTRRKNNFVNNSNK
jgi:Terminase large subunit, T4likevirus-type, N-terminal